eukprot:CAMPEP_0194476224 /NCGR_PEP_ID=MMETSP0253-20130528/138_1 /TAXON_ID=2966 /ORGANISM="Noctiluca scintillans" /LENGTH=92 /DNA_ID=CAMNT_0039315069 /DNA_START=29 /DNA_END=303 /DNA_ORIENTATION=-
MPPDRRFFVPATETAMSPCHQCKIRPGVRAAVLQVRHRSKHRALKTALFLARAPLLRAHHSNSDDGGKLGADGCIAACWLLHDVEHRQVETL